MDDGVTELEQRSRIYQDETIARIRVLEVPSSETYPRGVKYAFHYGVRGAPNPIIRFDNHHGPDELHLETETFELNRPALTTLRNA
ncbi:hypothetical protein BRD16_02125 [Halobacteriales archaeon SW_6_65_46]|nr:MAG: hypothetical protein BRD16_02125 [Halobacteriales archaeon SW_6_65_46]